VTTFNFSDLTKAADDAGFTVIPKSDYDLEVVTAEAKQTGTGKHKISVRFKVISGPYAGKSVFNDFVISPDNGTALGFFFRHMKVLGLDRGYFDTNPPLTAVASSIIGRRCTGSVSIREWQGQERNQLDGIKPLAGNVTGSAPMMPTPHSPGSFPPPLGMPIGGAPIPVPSVSHLVPPVNIVTSSDEPSVQTITPVQTVFPNNLSSAAAAPTTMPAPYPSSETILPLTTSVPVPPVQPTEAATDAPPEPPF
jgi:hypothetical protein